MSALLVPASSAACGGRRHLLCLSRYPSSNSKLSTYFLLQQQQHYRSHHRFLRVANDSSSSSSDISLNNNSGGGGGEERSEEAVDKIVDGMDFGELCNEFECISSPLVESTARQLLRDILELREGNRALGVFAMSVKYKDPLRSFTGRDKYKRQLWITGALQNPSVSVQEMAMLTTSVLRIRWTIKGKPKSIVAAAGADLIIRVDSQFTLNQISGQVIEHQEFWDLSASLAVAQAFFWASRRLYAAVEGGKDLAESVKKNLSSRLSNDNNKQNLDDMYPDPTGQDPTRFFQRDNSFQQDIYQIALFLAVLYFVVQFLRITL